MQPTTAAKISPKRAKKMETTKLKKKKPMLKKEEKKAKVELQRTNPPRSHLGVVGLSERRQSMKTNAAKEKAERRKNKKKKKGRKSKWSLTGHGLYKKSSREESSSRKEDKTEAANIPNATRFPFSMKELGAWLRGNPIKADESRKENAVKEDPEEGKIKVDKISDGLRIGGRCASAEVARPSHGEHRRQQHQRAKMAQRR